MADRQGVISNLNSGLENDLNETLNQEDIDALFDVLQDWNHILKHLPSHPSSAEEPQP